MIDQDKMRALVAKLREDRLGDEDSYAAAYVIDLLLAEVEAAKRERDELHAARIAYASEFPPDAEYYPDVGNIHANIRKLKSALADIANQDAVEMALDPTWAKRIASAALSRTNKDER